MNRVINDLARMHPSIPLLGLALLYAVPTVAGDDSGNSIAAGNMAMQLFGGLALFLFGMEQMAEGLKAVAGDRMKEILSRLTSNRLMGSFTGAFITAIIQSSSVTTVLVVGFITAGLMSFSQSIGVIMGSNIGTTVTAQIVAFKVTKAALPMIAVGFSMLFLSKNSLIKHYGGIIMGLGMVFFGMSVMSEAMKPLRTYQPFLDLMITMENPFIGILVAAGFTALVQSSSATTGIVIVMAAQGFISLPAGIALAFGANIGTCVTALLATIGKTREALRAAVAHIFFNVVGVLLWIAFIDQLAQFVSALSPSHPELEGTARLAAESPRQIANAHTIFNLANTFIFIWFTPQIARLIEWLVPDKPLSEELVIKAKYLDDALLDTPSLALDRVRMEIAHMGSQVTEMLAEILPAILHGNYVRLANVGDMDTRVDVLYAQIVAYLRRISRQELSDKQNAEFLELLDVANNLECIGDIIETDLVELGRSRIAKHVAVSQVTEEMLNDYTHVVMEAVETAIRAVCEKDMDAANTVSEMKSVIARLANSAAVHESRRLVAHEPNRIETYSIEMDIVEKLQRIYYHTKRMAKTVIEAEAEAGAEDEAVAEAG